MTGHSFGGLVAGRLLAQDLAAAVVAIDPAPIKGVIFLPPSALRVASVALRNPANRSRAVSLTEEQFRYGFGNAVSAEECKDLYQRWTIPSPGKTPFQAATANLSLHSPAATDLRELPDRGHSLTIDSGWSDVADVAPAWLEERGF